MRDWIVQNKDFILVMSVALPVPIFFIIAIHIAGV